MMLLAALVASPALARGAAQAEPEAVPATDPTNPIALALRDHVGGKLRDVYRARGYWPFWIEGDALGPQAAALIEVIEGVHVDGLQPRRYSPDRLRRLLETTPPGDARALAYAEVAFSNAFGDLVRDMRAPQDDPDGIDYVDPAARPKKVQPADALRRAGLSRAFTDYVRQLGWMNPLYARLRTALLTAEDRAPRVDVVVPPGPLLRQGDTGERVALLRERLGMTPGDTFDAALAARIRRLQSAGGVPADGIVGAQTLALLNRAATGPDRRALLRLNLARARPLPDAFTRHIVVDAAGARLWYYGEGAEQGTMRVVSGTAETPTPMMAGMVRYATLNPYWNMPVDLVRKRIAPQMLKGRSLRSLGYEVLSGFTADAEVVDPKTIDWRAVADGLVEPRVRELPGRGNSMGSVKYMFPNEEGIFLHDTPQKALFGKPRRHFSNGCIRLEDAKRLGRWLFGRDLKPEGSAPEQHVPVPEPVPVFLTYFTAAPSDGGIVTAPDIYGRDAMVLGNFEDR